MKRLTYERFYTMLELCNFVNINHIQKEDIQTIAQFRDRYTLLYWKW